MEDQEYESRALFEDTMWWFRASHAIQLWQLEQSIGSHTGRILEAGCGTGGILRKLHKLFSEATVLGFDYNDRALSLTAQTTALPLVKGSVNQLPFADDAFSGMISSDVFYHKGVDPGPALGEAHRCLGPGGVLVMTAPAYEWLYSSHDDRSHTARRYTRRRLVDAFRSAGLEVVYATYWNTLLFPLMVLRRKLIRPADGQSDTQHFPPMLDGFLHAVMVLERFLLRAGLRLPFGGSVLVVGRKPAERTNAA
jgi:SAM-dependent methyltransferase